jgi:DNA topoisomerase-3
VVTSAVGHLVEIQAPEEFDVKRGKWSFAHLPVIPPRFDLKPVDKTKSRLAAVVKQAKRKDVTALVNACDAGREGELIFRLIEQYAGGAKGATCAATSRCRAWPPPRAAAARPTGSWASTARAP